MIINYFFFLVEENIEKIRNILLILNSFKFCLLSIILLKFSLSMNFSFFFFQSKLET